ncbi:hypothetical protein ABIB34_004205 [Rhodococcus sp. UYP5]
MSHKCERDATFTRPSKNRLTQSTPLLSTCAPKAGQGYVVVDRTKNGAGKSK